MLPSSSGGYNVGPCGAHSGKRISRPVDLPEFSWPPESRLKENGLLLGTTLEENTRESTLNQSKCAQMVATNPVVASRMPLEIHNVSSGFVREVGAVEQKFCQGDTSYAFSHRRVCAEEANRFGNSCALEQSHQCSNSTESNNPSYRDILSSGVSASTEEKVGGRLLHNDVQGSIGSFDNRVDSLLETRGRSRIEADIKMKDLEAMDKENLKNSLTTDLSSKDGHCPSDGVQQVESKKSKRSSHKLDKKSRLPPNKMPLAAEKLWDGSLQLNSSITVCVVAFFKSGEKLLDLKWSEFVEVKGKVRLDAFEKYIQDLPRSRNRGLMVISLCFKEGSSEKGLKGMKEVAKGYIKGERVGFARLSPGVDLYLCPRSDAIITILAKYGFFKGMAAVEGNSELMIGCVVWRKNQTALTSVAKRPEGKANSLPEQLQKSPSNSSTLQDGVQSSLPVPSVENSKPSTSLNSFSAIEKADVITDNDVGIDSSSRITVTTSAVKSPPFQQQDTGLQNSRLQGSKEQLSTSEACVHHSNAEPAKESIDQPKAATSLQSNSSKPNMVFSDDDDLPEFDFGTASGISSSHCSADNKLQHSGSRTLEMSKQPTIPFAPSVSMCIPRSVSSVSQDMPLARNSTDHRQLVTVSRQIKEKHNSQNAIPVTVSASGSPTVPFDNLGKKSIFCDDDMPEWLPPDAQNEKTNEPPVNFAPEYSNSTSRKLPPFPTGSVFPSSQPSPPLYHLPANSKVPPPIPSQHGPSYLTGFTFNPIARPQSGSLAAESSLQPADKRARRS